MANPGKIGKLLVAEGMVSEEQLQEAIQVRDEQQVRIGTALASLGHLNENVLATFLSKIYGISAVSLDGVNIPDEVIESLPASICKKHLLVPLKKDANGITIAISDPSNVSAVDDIRFLCNLDVQVYISTETGIQSLIDRYYVEKEATNHTGLIDSDVQADEIEEAADGTVEIGSADNQVAVEEEGVADNKPTIRLINKIFVEAIRRGTSDIHIEPYKEMARVRFRMNGALHEVMRIPGAMRTAVAARVKVMSSLDISERRLPQDGRIQIKTKQKELDVRVSILPTVFGEKVCMRLLGGGGKPPSLSEIGFEQSQLKLFEMAAEQPYGMVLVTGPTGSGKSTTLFAALNELNGPDVNISTVEDPVEYNMIGVNQTQVKSEIGLTFASALRSLLRQDPDIIMLGEIRDQETAEIAVKSALTGHMVFSTLHTNDAASTITRLHHMGIEPFLITAAVSLVQAQRLIRVLCQNCKEPDTEITNEQLLHAEVPKEKIGQFAPMKAVGCDECGGTGYAGRRGVFEVMGVTEALRELVIEGANADQLKRKAIEEGMISLRMSALEKLYKGETTLQEVLYNSRPDKDHFVE